ncbi:hypothetical protein ACFVU2_12875 [Leifsonia sp. NPDC058194]|uniref:hypothetical protein n=1 Tax=Leifsonia sp. NPDC058194 TaxID=3346374 RepID=UPI0036D88098
MSDTLRAVIAFGAIWLVCVAAVLGAWSLPSVCAAVYPSPCSPRQRDAPALTTLALLGAFAVAAVVLAARRVPESWIAWLALASGLVGLGGAGVTAFSAGFSLTFW